MVNILPVASGKGGVGKTSLSMNLAILLAQKNKKVILADFDFGGANLHTLLGLKNNHAGLGNFIYKQENSFDTLLQDTGIEGLRFIAGDCLLPGTANLGFFAKNKIIKEIQKSDADYFILDLGAGSAYNTLDFFLLTHNSILVSTPEITSILNAYSFLKSAAFRFFTRQFKAKSPERSLIQEFIAASGAGAETSFVELVQKICMEFPETGEKAAQEMKKFRPQVIINMGESVQDLEMAKRLRSLALKKLDMNIDFVGFVPRDKNLPLSIARRKPLALTDPDGKFIVQARYAAERILRYSYDYAEMYEMELGQDDMSLLSQEFTQINRNT
ncbi:MAG: P-loop NTPase [Treponema sp.]|nr:P-loop NTPase [Spirochaetia bacterium]MDY5682374.1 P-loop NTPase [Treponema sp.]